MTIEKIFELNAARIEWFAVRSSSQMLFLCTLVPIPPAKFSWYNSGAEQLNEYMKAYVAHDQHVVLINIYNRMRKEIE